MISTFIKMVKVTKDKERLRSCHELEDATKVNEEYWIGTEKRLEERRWCWVGCLGVRAWVLESK